MQIAVVDLGIGNLRSVQHALTTVAPTADVVVTKEASVIDQADRVVLPGQGAIGTWFQALHERGLEQTLRKSINDKPMLGICVGMQALFQSSDEDGGVTGLGLFDGKVQHFSQCHNSQDNSLKIPQMGWNKVKQTREHPLWQKIQNESHFYFVHSYCANAAPISDAQFVCGQTDYGHEFISAVAHKNVFAVQFHPEKSHHDGLQLLQNFTNWQGEA